MKSIILDIETIPADAKVLEEALPDDIKLARMPDELARPYEPNWEDKCPKYGGDETKRKTWMTDAKKKWVGSTAAAAEKWTQGIADARAKFIESAALRAETAHCKLIGITRPDGGKMIYLFEPDRSAVDICEKECTRQKIALFSPFLKEAQMFRRFANDLIGLMQDTKELTDGVGEVVGKAHMVKNRLITYYGNTFDLPFLARRAAICGVPALMKWLRMHRRGRYLNGEILVDLHEEWTLGDRETRTGGLDGLARILGVPISKSRDGATFYHWYKENPAEGIQYLIDDLEMTKEIAMRVGLLELANA